MPLTSSHIVPTTNNEASGPSYSVTRLCRALIEAGHPTRLAVLEPLPDEAVAASGVGGIFPKGNVVVLRVLLEEMITSGSHDHKQLHLTADWAHGLGAKAGAEYLADILTCVYDNGARPEPPWSSSCQKVKGSPKYHGYT